MPTIGITGGNIAICSGTTATLSGTGAVSYSWTGGITNGTAFTPSVGTNNYTVTGTDANGCTNTATTSVTVNALPTIGITGGNIAICSGATATLSGTGAVSYSWTGGITNGTAFIPSVGTNNYTVTGTDANGCTNTATTSITVNALPTIGITGGNIAICSGTTATLSGTGAVSYSWTGGIINSTAFTPSVGTNNYTVTGTDANGCTSTATTSVTVNALPTIGITGGNIAICSGATATLSGTGAVSYSWTGGITNGTAFTPSVGTNNYTVTGTDANGCTNTATTSITVNALPTIGITGGNIAICSGATATLSGTGAVSYSWTGGITNGTAFTPSVGTNNYTVTGTDANGCTNTATTSVTVNALPTIGITGGNIAICSGATATLSGTGAVSYSWTGGITNGTAFTPSVGTNNYTVTGTDANGCTNTATTSITVNALPTIGITGGNIAICSGATATLSGTGAVSYSWTGGITNGTAFTPSVGTNNYTVTGTDANGCTNTATTSVTVNALPTIGITGGNIAICSGATATLSGTGAVSYSWTGGITNGTAFTPSVGTNNYTVTGTDANGCTNTATTSVTVNALPTIGITGGNIAICSGTTATLSGTGAVSYSWTGGITNGTAFTPSVGTNNYTVTGTDANGCTNTATTSITVNALPTIGITGGNIAICSGATATLSGTSAVSYSWTGGITNGTAFTPSVGTNNYTVTGTDANGCTNTATTSITVNALPTIGITGGNIAICSGATATLSGTGAVSYSWTGGITNGTAFTPSVGTNNYTVTGTDANGCTNTATTSITVNALPTIGITGGNIAICSGTTATLSGTGAVSYSWTGGITNGTAFTPSVGTNNYTVTGTDANGCTNTASTTITVNQSPSSIYGVSQVCVGSTITLTDAVSGGSWTTASGNISLDIAGDVTGSVAGTSVVTYTLPTGCYITSIVTINPLPSAISGTAIVCAGSSTYLSDTPTGGSWSSNNTSIATVGVSNGIVSGVSYGSTTITYSLSTGCIAIEAITVNPVPSAIFGTKTVCITSTTTLSNTYSGGAWSSSNSNAVVNITGIVTGETVGTSVISYMFPAGCLATAVVTVNSLPGVILGATNICVGSTTILSDATSGGTWSSGNPSIATVGSSSSIVTGIGAGTDNIIYTLSNGCSRNYSVTVNAVAAITGNAPICVGTTLALSDATTSGTWSSSNTAHATIGASTGLVTAVASGTANITYTSAAGCTTVTIVTVNSIASISGPSSFCQGASGTLSDAASGGTWSSSNSSVASIGTSGIITALSAGTTSISYTIAATGCSSGATIIVNPITPILGTLGVCNGSGVTLSDSTSGGTWSSNNTTIATIGVSTGVVTSTASGTTTITYLESTGCKSIAIVTINPVANILGTGNVCAGATISLSNAVAGGTWSTSNSAIASVGSTGIVSGIASGTATISYITAHGCMSTVTLTVNQVPVIYGAHTLCSGTGTTFTDNVSGGTWSSTNTSVLAINASSGSATSSASGTAVISYSLPSGCAAGIAVTVTPVPTAIAGSNLVCIGSLIRLSDGVSGGSWSASGNASVDGSGNVTGLSAGTATISYSLGTGCTVATVVNIAAPPAAITGTSVCAGNTVSFTDAVSGGTWSSSNISIASIGSSTGLVSAIAGGTASISYATAPGAGCTVSAIVSVQALAPISGSPYICIGGADTLALTDGSTGGTWSSSSANVSIGSTGVVTGLSTGTALVTYTIPSGCSRTILISISNPPSAISGNFSVCAGSTTSLSDGVSGGYWSASSLYATVGSSSGIVMGSNTYIGTATITYSTGAGCTVTAVVSVSANPGPIQGNQSECEGIVTSLSDGSAGGTWSGVGDITVATAGSNSGTVTGGSSAGTGTVTYTLPTGCYVTYPNTVYANPSAITGVISVCVGGYTSLTDTTANSISWTSSNTAIATADNSATITGVAAGTAVITYKILSGCISVTTVTVIPALTAESITTSGGSFAECEGTSSISLSDSYGTGTWTSSLASVAAIGTSGGPVTGYTPGTATISYVPSGSAGCLATHVVTVNQVAPIVGSFTLCSGSSTSFDNVVSGGTWSSSGAAATVGSAGTVTAVSAGTATISYTTGAGCSSLAVVTVEPLAVLSGNSPICIGSSITLTPSQAGGTWATPGSNASVDGSGNVTGISSGTAVISYTSPSGCISTTVVTVNSFPSAISGATATCLGSSFTLTDAVAGGSWSSSGAATIGSSTGVVTGITSGTALITYAVSATCSTTTVVTINQVPGAISGASSVCAGATISLSDIASGGTWASSNGNVIVDGSGNVTGAADVSGSSVITYTLADGCSVTTVVNVTTPPSAITGTTSVCLGLSTTLSDSPSGGVWSSTGAAISIGSSSGVVAGLSAGTGTVTYTIGSGCIITTVVNVYALPQAISGVPPICAGGTATLSDTGTGTWSCSSLVATVGSSSGIVSASPAYAGTATVAYTAASGCSTTTVITVVANPANISGAASFCSGSTVTLSDATAGGAWSSSGTITVGTSGTVTGSSVGTGIVTYTSVAGCATTHGITVLANPSAILGSTTFCVGGYTILSDATSGSISWTSSNTAIASASNSGTITGVAAGSATVTFTISSGCFVTAPVTVVAQPGPISGNTHGICPGASIALTDGSGTWASSNTAVAIVGTSGIVTGISSGTATITYLPSGTSGCTATTIITINTAAAITGAGATCLGNTITLNDATSGGTWSSSNVALATVGSATGVVNTVAAGVVTISYTTSGGCVVTTAVSINAAPTAIAGTKKVCLGSTTTLSDASGAGTWTTSGGSGTVTVDGSGDVTGVDAGTAIITYASGTCYTTAIVTVNNLPSPIYGTATVCSGAVTSLSDGTTGGTWSSTVGVTVGSTGLVSGGGSTGTATVSYILSATGCSSTRVVTVNAAASAIAGNSGAACIGATIALSDVGGGTWSSSNANATVGSASGLVAAVTAGTAVITYFAVDGCYATTVATVSPAVAAISGASSLCSSATISLSDATTGGTWSSSNTAVGSVSATGIVAGISAGTTTITYTSAAGCTKSVTLTVNPAPSPIGGVLAACLNGTTTLTDATTPGTWSMSSIVGSVGSASGIVTASNTYTGTATVYYTSAGCSTSSVLTVNANPGPVQGAQSECAGITITLSDATAGGVWSSTGDISIVSTGATTASLTAAGVAGTGTVTYTSAAGCRTTYPNTVYANPAAISGTFAICAGTSTNLTDATSGSISWTSSNTGVATAINSGTITGVAAGTATITYKISTGSCIATQVVTVNAVPVVTAITGPSTISYSGGAVTLSDVTSGGVWVSSNSSVISLSGTTGATVTAMALSASGSSVVSYAVTNVSGCSTTVTKAISASSAPAPYFGSGGTTIVSAGTTVDLVEDIMSGIWSSSDNTVATVDQDGLVTGITPGSANITHIITMGDGTTTTNVTSVVVTAIPWSVTLLPNPNKGIFTIRGSLGSLNDEAVNVEVTDVLGQVIYRSKLVTQEGKFNETISLSSTLANGMYMLNIQSGTENKTLHFVIEQ